MPETMLLYCLPIIGSYIGGTPDTSIFLCIPAIRKRRKQCADYISDGRPHNMPKRWTTYGNGNTGRPPETAGENRHRRQNSRKYINHSGNVGNRFQAPQISRIRQIMTSWWHRTQVVIIFRQFQKSVQPVFRSWKNRKRGTLYARTRKAPAVQEISRNVLTITGNDLRGTVFRNQRQF